MEPQQILSASLASFTIKPMKSRFFRLFPFALISAALPCATPARAADLTWDGGGADASWLTGANWIGDPATVIMGIGSTQTFYSVPANLSNFLGGGRVLGTLAFNSDADSDVSVRFQNAANAGVNLTMDVASGSAAINVDAGATGNITLGVSGGSILLNDPLAINHNGTGNLTIDRPILNAFAVAKSGTGVLTLAAGNTFAGLTLNSGTLNINHASALGAATGTFTINGGTLDNTTAAAISTVSAPIAVENDFAFAGTRDLTLAGAANLGASAGTVRTITVNGGNLTFSGNISNGTTAKSITKDGAGTLVYSAVNSYTGLTTIDAGTLKQGVGNVFGTGNGTPMIINSAGTFDVNGKGSNVSSFSGSGTVDNSAATGATLNIGKNNVGGTFSGTIKNSGGGDLGVWKWGTGQTAFSGANTYTGLTWVVGGVLIADTISNLAAPAASSLGAPTDAANGTIRFGSGVGSSTLRYTGATTTTDRAIDLRGTTGGGTLDASGTGTISFTGDMIATGAGSKTLGFTGTNTGLNTFAGKIDNNSASNLTSVSKFGNGTWVLSGDNTYSGTTSVSSGALLITGAHTTGGAYTVTGTGTLGGTGSITTGDANVTIAGILSPGMSAGTLTFAVGAATVDISAASQLVFELGTVSDLVNINTGSLTIGNGVIGFSDFAFSDAGGLTSGAYTLFQTPGAIVGTLDSNDLSGSFAGMTGTLAISGNNLVLNVVPEPTTAALAALALLPLLRRRRL